MARRLWLGNLSDTRKVLGVVEAIMERTAGASNREARHLKLKRIEKNGLRNLAELLVVELGNGKRELDWDLVGCFAEESRAQPMYPSRDPESCPDAAAWKHLSRHQPGACIGAGTLGAAQKPMPCPFALRWMGVKHRRLGVVTAAETASNRSIHPTGSRERSQQEPGHSSSQWPWPVRQVGVLTSGNACKSADLSREGAATNGRGVKDILADRPKETQAVKCR
ncbi:hypothetical protein B0H12DRAFT_1293094 [Mycena haematopus]|nr:hypothetical protein B0H12DRAFT_1293094 [Mycena haematopus]